jgi:hypothetical protein
MKMLYDCKTVLFVLVIGICAGRAVSAEPSAEVDQSLEILLKGWRNEGDPQIKEVLDHVQASPQFGMRLIDEVIKRLDSKGSDDRSARKEFAALRMLKAVEVVEQLRERWNKMEKKTYGLEFGDSRSQLLKTIAKLLPEEQSVQFLIKTESDKEEPAKIRARTTILLCASGNQKAIEHVLSVYEQAKRKYPVTTRVRREDQPPPASGAKSKKAARPRPPKNERRNQDNDMMNDYIERGLLLDPCNPDTDGDGLLDGNDRNPFSKPDSPPLPDPNVIKNRQIANFLFYFYAGRDGSQSPFAFNLWIVRKIDNYDHRKIRPNFFNGMELTGINGIVLHMDQEQVKQYRAIHGWGTKEVNIHEMKESRNGEREFRLSISQGRADHRSYRIRVKRFNGVWLPVYWELGVIT